MDRYCHVGLHDVAAALGTLPAFPSTGPDTNPPRDAEQPGPMESPLAPNRPRLAGRMLLAPQLAPTGPKLAPRIDSKGLRLITGENDEGLEAPLWHLQEKPEMIGVDNESGADDKRRGRDSNPRYPCGQIGFRDRRIQPLCHLSRW